MSVSARTARLVQERAAYRCEYCQVYGWPLTVDHVLPQADGGTDDPENLAAACFPCNRLKSAHVSAVDPLSGERVRLFNPRLDVWAEHFGWSADYLMLLGRTATGRATAALLQFGRADRQRQRAVLRASALGGGTPWP